MCRSSLRGFFIALTGALCSVAAAADFEPAGVLLCAVQEVRSCMPYNKCEATPPEPVGIPDFIRIEFDQKKISDMMNGGGDKTIAIERQKLTRSEIYLQGHEGYAWTLSIARKNGRFNLTTSETDYTFVVFGSCTLPE